jgi:hypothetical protein
MKFYRDKQSWDYWVKITNNKLNAIYFDIGTWFFKNGKLNNAKNAAYNQNDEYKEFTLNDECYGDETNFTKQSWRKFARLQAFL